MEKIALTDAAHASFVGTLEEDVIMALVVDDSYDKL